MKGKFLQRKKKHLMCFQSKTFAFKFLHCSVDEKHLMCFQSETSPALRGRDYIVFNFLTERVGCTVARLSSSDVLCFTRRSQRGHPENIQCLPGEIRPHDGGERTEL